MMAEEKTSFQIFNRKILWKSYVRERLPTAELGFVIFYEGQIPERRKRKRKEKDWRRFLWLEGVGGFVYDGGPLLLLLLSMVKKEKRRYYYYNYYC